MVRSTLDLDNYSSKIISAHDRIKDYIHNTPLLSSSAINKISGSIFIFDSLALIFFCLIEFFKISLYLFEFFFMSILLPRYPLILLNHKYFCCFFNIKCIQIFHFFFSNSFCLFHCNRACNNSSWFTRSTF